MPSDDARTLLKTVLPTAAAGVIAAGVSGAVAGGKGAIGAVVATVVVIVLMGLGLAGLERTAKSMPQVFQMMGLVLYAVQLLLMVVFLAAFRHTDLFNPRAFAFSLVAATLVWIGAQTRAHMKAKILYVDPDATDGSKPTKSGASA